MLASRACGNSTSHFSSLVYLHLKLAKVNLCVYVMGVFHWGHLVSHYGFLEDRVQCLHSWLGSVVGQQNIKHVLYFTYPPQLFIPTVAPPTDNCLVLSVYVLLSLSDLSYAITWKHLSCLETLATLSYSSTTQPHSTTSHRTILTILERKAACRERGCYLSKRKLSKSLVTESVSSQQDKPGTQQDKT